MDIKLRNFEKRPNWQTANVKSEFIEPSYSQIKLTTQRDLTAVDYEAQRTLVQLGREVANV